MSDDTPLAATPHNAQQIISQSAATAKHMGEKTTVLHCTLPNGFEIVVSSACADPDDYDHDAGLTACFGKLEDRIIDLLAQQQHGPLA